MTRRRMIIAIDFPDTVLAGEIKDYAQDALEHWGGQRHPDDHLFAGVRAPKGKMKIVPGPVVWSEIEAAMKRERHK